MTHALALGVNVVSRTGMCRTQDMLICNPHVYLQRTYRPRGLVRGSLPVDIPHASIRFICQGNGYDQVAELAWEPSSSQSLAEVAATLRKDPHSKRCLGRAGEHRIVDRALPGMSDMEDE